jgi:methionine-rich copper-binding protein CopC
MKKTILFLIISLVLIPNLAYAHTNLDKSSPADGEVLTESPEEILLNFNTKVEQGSQFQLVNPSGNGVSITGLTIDDKVLSGFIPQPLQGGEYTINWSIIGADGHPIEGQISFAVESESANGEEPNQITNEDEPPALEEKVVEETQPASPPTFIPIMAITLLVIAIVSCLYVSRKGKIR